MDKHWDKYWMVITDDYKGTIHGLFPGLATTFGILLAVALIYYVISERKTGKLSVQSAIRYAFKYVFPSYVWKHRSTRMDLMIWPITTFVVQPAFTVAGVAVGFWGAEEVTQYLNSVFGAREPLLHGAWTIALTQALILVLTSEFIQAVVHNAIHKVPFLWEIHKVHHSAEVLTTFTGNRIHPLDFFFEIVFCTSLNTTVVGGLVIFLIGVPLSPLFKTANLLLSYLMARQIYSALAHSHVRLDWPWRWLNYIIESPATHLIHHSAEHRHRDKNMAFFGFMDWMLGTLYIPEKNETWRTGCSSEELGENNPHLRLRDVYLSPVVRMWQTMKESMTRKSTSTPISNS